MCISKSLNSIETYRSCPKHSRILLTCETKEKGISLAEVLLRYRTKEEWFWWWIEDGMNGQMWSPQKEFTKMTDENDILLLIYRTQYRRHKQLDTMTMFSCFSTSLAPLNISVTRTDTCSLLFYAISTLVRASKGRVCITYAGMSTQATPLRMLKILLQIFPSTFSES